MRKVLLILVMLAVVQTAGLSLAQTLDPVPPTPMETPAAPSSPPVQNPKDRLPFKVLFRGVDAIIKEVYWSIIDLPPDAPLNEVNAELVRLQVLNFLLRAGYTAATVEVSIDKKKEYLMVTVDEGRIDMIIVEGQGTISTIQFNFLLNMTHRVFNKYYVERHIEQFKKMNGLASMTYELREKTADSHSGMQIDLTRLLANPKDSAARHPLPRRWDLIFTVEKTEWATGFSGGLDDLSSSGLSLAFGYRGAGLFFDQDRWDVGLLGGGTLRKDLEDDSNYMAPNRARVATRYFSPPITSPSLRLQLSLLSDLQGTQRKEFLLEEYFTETLEAGLGLYWHLGDTSYVTFGGGWQSKYLFGVDQLENPPVVLEANERHRPFVASQLDLELGKASLRSDQRHSLGFEGRHYWGETDSYDRFRATYELPIRFGWHQLWLKASATKLWGEVPVGDEEKIDRRYVRGVFNERYFVREVASASAEFRYSLIRDQFKLSLFTDFACFGGQAHVDDSNDLRWAGSAGPGINVLLLDAFQLDIYYAFGLNNDNEFEYGFITAFEKAF